MPMAHLAAFSVHHIAESAKGAEEPFERWEVGQTPAASALVSAGHRRACGAIRRIQKTWLALSGSINQRKRIHAFVHS